MARNINGGTDRISVSSAVVTAYPFTAAIWFKMTVTTIRDLFCISDNTTNNMWLMRAVSGAGGVLRFRTVGSATQNVDSTNTIVSGAWSHGCIIGASATDRSVILDGGTAATGSTNSTPAGVSGTRIGSGPGGINVFNGDVAEGAVWNVALSTADVASLAKGASPTLIRPDALVAYWQMIGRSSPEPDFVGRYDLTLTGTAQAAHPKIFYPSRRRLIAPAAAAANVIGVGLIHSQRL